LLENLNDKALWGKMIEGGEDAFSYIYNAYFPSLYKYGMKILADSPMVKDCIHDLFVNLWLSRKNLSETDNIKYYLFTSLRRRIARHNSNGTMQLAGDDTDVFMPSPEQNLIDRQNKNEQHARMSEIIKKLPKRQQEVLYLRYYEGLSPEQTAALMQLSINSTYVLLSKALSFLKKNSDDLMIVLAYISIHGRL
jgi:RNA polymerase sigma factor (sigma-70 family)